MGGHGGLNILFQKSWNVYNLDNRLKVDKDKAKAAAKVQEQERVTNQSRLNQTLTGLRKRRQPDAEEQEEELPQSLPKRSRHSASKTRPLDTPSSVDDLPSRRHMADGFRESYDRRHRIEDHSHRETSRGNGRGSGGGADERFDEHPHRQSRDTPPQGLGRHVRLFGAEEEAYKERKKAHADHLGTLLHEKDAVSNFSKEAHNVPWYCKPRIELNSSREEDEQRHLPKHTIKQPRHPDTHHRRDATSRDSTNCRRRDVFDDPPRTRTSRCGNGIDRGPQQRERLRHQEDPPREERAHVERTCRSRAPVEENSKLSELRRKRTAGR